MAKTFAETVQCVVSALLSQPGLTLTRADLSACDYNPIAVELAVEALVKEGKAWTKGETVGLCRRSEKVQGSLNIIPNPPGVTEHAPMKLLWWCEEYGIERPSFSRDFRKGEFDVRYDGASDRYVLTTWQNGRTVDGCWVEGHTIVVASHDNLTDALLELAGL